VLAGIQIALTQPLLIDDIVVVEGEFGQIEEITLTYVTVRTWDLRRMICQSPICRKAVSELESRFYRFAWRGSSVPRLPGAHWRIAQGIEAARRKQSELGQKGVRIAGHGNQANSN
jgi:hypothetical protein